MRCYICGCLNIDIFCKNCTEKLLAPKLLYRKIGSLDVISFYPYTTIESLLLTKHTPEGYRIYKALANLSTRPFVQKFTKEDKKKLYILGVDEYVKRGGYSHVSVLTHAMNTKYSKPLHGVLMAKNRVKYAGKNLQFRLENPRNFIYKGEHDIDVILVDDIITTGITLQEAHNTLIQSGVNVLFALTLADAKE